VVRARQRCGEDIAGGSVALARAGPGRVEGRPGAVGRRGPRPRPRAAGLDPSDVSLDLCAAASTRASWPSLDPRTTD
jgi:hypothetical protein